MSVQARFYVSEITQAAYQPGASTVKLQPVSRGPENKTWAAATPAGSISLTISNAAASTWFVIRLGKEVAITFEDRPLQCVVCHEEIDPVVGPYDSRGASWRTLDDGNVVHTDCKE